jgi:uncharacterized protein
MRGRSDVARAIDDGVICSSPRTTATLRIEVGQGLEGVLPDAIAKRIIEETIIPRFRSGDFYGGIADGVERIIAVIEGEPLPPPRRGVGDGRLPQDSLPFLLMAPLLVGGFVRMTMNRFLGATSRGGARWRSLRGGSPVRARRSGSACFCF